MLCRGRSCLTGQRQRLSAILDSVSPAASADEPLLFLYPRGLQAQLPVLQRRDAAIAPVRRRGLSTCACPCPLSRRLRASSRLEGVPASVRWISTGAEGSHSERELGEDAIGTVESYDDGHGHGYGHGHHQAEGQAEEQTIWETRRRANIFAGMEGSSATGTATAAPMAVHTRYPPTRMSALRKTHLRTLTPTAIKAIATIRTLLPRDRRRLRHRAFLKDPPRWVSGAKQDWRKWTHIRRLLDRLQRDHPLWVGRGLKHQVLKVPEETVALIGGVTDIALKENILYAPIRHGIRIHVLPPGESEGHLRKLVVSGSAGGVREVSERILGAAKLQASADPLIDIRKPPVPVYPSLDALKRRNIEVPRMRGVWDFYRAKENTLPIEVLLEGRFEPETPRELLEFIEDLIGSRMSGPYRRQKGGTRRQMSRNQSIEHALVDLFRSQENRRILSTAALNKALGFLCNRNLRASRIVFARGEHVATVDSYNILLRSCAKRQDVRLFIHLVHTMGKKEIRPDAYTWVALLNCPITTEVKVRLFTYIHQRGILTHVGAMRSALQATIADMLSLHLDSGKDMDAFIQTMRNSYGANWFTPSMINQMLYVVSNRKNRPALNRMLELCDQHGLEIDASSLMHVLPMYRASIFDALRFCYRYITRPRFRMTRDLYEKLFLIAFKGRCFNVCRVLWRYACMHGMTTYRMKMCVLSTITTNVPKKKSGSGGAATNPMDTIWRSSAGKVIVGVDLHCADRPGEGYFLEHTPAQHRRNPVLSLTSGYKSGEEREHQLQLATELVRRDIELGRRYAPVLPLAMLLDAAAVVDIDWRNIPHPPDWMLKHAVMVPVEWQGYLHS